MSVRLRRLYADYVRISEIFSENPYIAVKNAIGKPPEKYEIEFNIKGLEQKGKNTLQRERHLVEIVLPYGYPREAPKCSMLTPIFHPNIAPHTICIGDHWIAGESLADLIVRIGEMICFQSYNIKSPLNGEAAKWAEENIFRLPIDRVDLTPKKRAEDITVNKIDMEKLKPVEIKKQEVDTDINKSISSSSEKEEESIELEFSETPAVKLEEHESVKICLNCRAKGPDVQFMKCNEGHVICSDCITECQICGKTLCMLCSFGRCPICKKLICSECRLTCSSCAKVVCKDHIVKCDFCQVELCSECTAICSECNGHFCESHLNKTTNLCIKCSPEFDKGNRNQLKITNANEDLPGIEVNHCKKCGRKIEYKAALFCTACGNKLR